MTQILAIEGKDGRLSLVHPVRWRVQDVDPETGEPGAPRPETDDEMIARTRETMPGGADAVALDADALPRDRRGRDGWRLVDGAVLEDRAAMLAVARALGASLPDDATAETIKAAMAEARAGG